MKEKTTYLIFYTSATLLMLILLLAHFRFQFRLTPFKEIPEQTAILSDINVNSTGNETSTDNASQNETVDVSITPPEMALNEQPTTNENPIPAVDAIPSTTQESTDKDFPFYTWNGTLSDVQINDLPVINNVYSMQLLVNKERTLPQGYRPTNLVMPNVLFANEGDIAKNYLQQEAATQLEALFGAAKENNHILYAVSGYRSYERQQQLFKSHVSSKGYEQAEMVSAKAGTSEHQTGLAMDVSTTKQGFSLRQSFGNDPEGIWLAEHAHEYGFIIRYPKNKTAITGYSYEPWHIRYVGKPLATYLVENQLTLEEFYLQNEQTKQTVPTTP